MTDAELRGRLLTFFFERRHNADGLVPTTDIIVSGGDHVSRQAIAGVCQQLADAELIHWEPLTGAREGFTIGMAKITGLGVDVVTGGRVSSIDIRFPNAGRPDLPAAIPTVKKPERINLADGLKLLEEHLPAEEAKARLRQAFVQKEFSQAPLFALPYDEAIIDWTTGSVKIPRKNDRFCPMFLRADFDRYFLEKSQVQEISHPLAPARSVLSRGPTIENYPGGGGQGLDKPAPFASVAQPPQKPAELLTLRPTFMGMSIDLKELLRRLWSWWQRR